MSKQNRIAKEQLRRQLQEELGLTKEEKIALNKAKVAKYHHEPDISTISPHYARTLSKLKHEKDMLEKAKKIWYSIVSVPMGGLKK